MDLLKLIGELAKHVPDEPESICADEYEHWPRKVVNAETRHRRYLITGVRVNNLGDVIVQLVDWETDSAAVEAALEALEALGPGTA